MEEVSIAQRGRDLIRRGPFAQLWWSQAISSIGDWVNLFATFALAANLAGGGRAATIAILVPLVGRILPGLFFGFLGGLIADRWSRKTTMIVSDFGRAVLVLGLLFVTSYTQMFVLILVIEVFALIRQPAREAVVPTLVKREHLLAVNGLNLAAMYGTAPIGSLLFALLAEGSQFLPELGRVSSAVGTAFVFDCLTFLVSGLIVVFIPIQAPAVAAQRARGEREEATPWRDLVEGMRFAFRAGPVRRLILGMSAGLFGGGALFVLGQPFSEQVLRAGESGYGVLVTALGVGVGLGMIGVSVISSVDSRRENVFGLSLAMPPGWRSASSPSPASSPPPPPGPSWPGWGPGWPMSPVSPISTPRSKTRFGGVPSPPSTPSLERRCSSLSPWPGWAPPLSPGCSPASSTTGFGR
jgi:dTMP kinase